MYYFIVNPNARRGYGEKLWKRVERRLKKYGTPYEVFFTDRSMDAWNLARRFSGEGGEPGILVTVGGAGTLNEVLNGLNLDAHLTLGFLPTDARNDLTRGLGLPKSWKRMLKQIMEVKNGRLVDYGILSYETEEPAHRRFLMCCGVGLDAAACCAAEEGRSGNAVITRLFRRGRMRRAFAGAVRQMMAHPVRGYLLLDGERKVEFNRIYFVAANLYSHGGASHVRTENDGLLEVCVMHGLTRLLLLPAALDYWSGRRRPHRSMRFYRCRELLIHLDEPRPVLVDGESCCSQTEISLSCIRKKVRIVG